MSEEEKKALQYFYNLRATIDESNMLFDEDINVKCGKETVKQITTILNLIQSQQEEIRILKSKRVNMFEQLDCIEKKNKIIDMLFEEREHIKNNLEVDLNKKGIYSQAKGQISQILEYYKNNDKYFEKKVEGK